MEVELLNQINRINDIYVDWKYKSKSVYIYNTNNFFTAYERIVHKILQKECIILILIFFKAWKTINDTLGCNKKNLNYQHRSFRKIVI